MKKFVLDGKNMTSVESFYQEVQRVLCPNFRKMGKNLHAFSDVLRGGFGAFDEGETIHLWIIHKKHMKEHLQEAFVSNSFRIIEKARNIVLMKGVPSEDA